MVIGKNRFFRVKKQILIIKTGGLIQMKTEYTNLKNIDVPNCYRCDDTGIYYIKQDKSGKETTRVLIGEALSLIGLYIDSADGKEYTVFQYYDIHSRKAKNVAVESLNIKKGNFDELLKGSYDVSWMDGLKTFVREVKLMNKKEILKGGKSFMEIGTASTKYGFPRYHTEYDYNNFVGITTSILSTEQDRETDEALFVEKGTLEGWKADIQKIVKDAPANCESIFRLAIAAGLAGITLAFLPDYYYPPVIAFSGPTSIGKGMILSVVCSLYGHPTAGGGIRTTSDSSPAGMYALKGRLNQLPLCIEDIQDIFQDKNRGIDYISKMIFDHSKGIGSLRATVDGKKRNTITFRNVMMLFAETADLDKLTGGARARVIDFKIDRKDGERITKEPTNSYSIDNYGFAAKKFVMAMMEYNRRNNVPLEFQREVEKYTDKGVNVKHAATYALLSYTFWIAKRMNILNFWNDLTVDECIAQYNFEAESISADTKLYEALCAYILRHNNVYPFTKERIERSNYEIRLGTAEEIRGRLDKENCCCWIPTDTLNQVMEQCIKTNAICGINPDIRTLSRKWVKNGYIERCSKDKIQWTKSNITSPAVEKVYKLKMPEGSMDNLSVERNIVEYDSFGNRIIV